MLLKKKLILIDFCRGDLMIPFNIPPYVGPEIDYIKKAIDDRKICGDGEWTKKCDSMLETLTKSKKCLLTTSGTHALDMSALLCNLTCDDEVILPSFTFTSTANAFALTGAKLRFVDIRPDTMNIDENLIENAITKNTKVISVVHYAGVSCEMDKIMSIAKKYKLKVVEDAAQSIFSKYKGIPTGSIGNYGCLSFHETKNLSMGEGGALLINDEQDIERAEILREKGTDRSKFYRGQVDKYTWQDKGSSYLPSELNAAYLYGQLENADKIQFSRMYAWDIYNKELGDLEQKGYIELMKVPNECQHNAHMFYIKCKDLLERTKLIEFLRCKGIISVFHYIPLHSAPAGIKYGVFVGEDKYTTRESERLLRLPLYYNITEEVVLKVIDFIKKFYIK